ncbi:MAG TPA: polysaccharide export protein [Sedimenticola sp.]|nr:polysaccharide export protein [Sedimenticola sp.]
MLFQRLTPLGILLVVCFLPLPAALADGEGYRVQPGDILEIAVWKEEGMQSEVLVRPDGGLSFPLVGDVSAEGRTIEQLTGVITERLKRYIPEPVVTVALKKISGNTIYVIGRVNRPGEFEFIRRLDVMQALSKAGGTTPFAELDKIKILRRSGGVQQAIPFDYGEVEKGRELEQNILLESGDVVVVP